MEHGGVLCGAELDFSANVSPLGVPEGVLAAVRAAAETADRYPDPECRALRTALAKEHGVPIEWILCGAGAAELIYRLCLAERPKRALLPAPAFSEYEKALRASLCGEIAFFSLPAFPEERSRNEARNGVGDRERAAQSLDELRALIGRSDAQGETLLFLCQPNNPTGLSLPRGGLKHLLRLCRDRHCRLVVDECFVPFTDDPGALTLLRELAKYPELVILRAFTKLYGMAGLRLGCALSSDTALLARMRVSGPPWSVSGVAQAAGLAALKEKDYVNRVRALIASERPRVYRALLSLGLEVIPGEANFLLFRGPKGLAEKLLKKGIAIRPCGNFRGLDERCYRVCLRTREENDRLIADLGEVLMYGR